MGEEETNSEVKKEKERMEERLQREDHFRTKAGEFIKKVSELHKEADDETRDKTSVLVDEILHSIFFLGKIHTPPVSPEQIVDNDVLKSRYRQSFQLYSSQLPRRSPFSCVLDMMVKLVGPENEEEIRRRLQEFITDVEDGVPSEHLISTAICVSQKSKDSMCVRHYGVSMSTSSRIARNIVIAASCLSAWDDYVAGAVMTYYPKKSKKSYFDGTIKIPEDVRCQTFSLRNGRIMNPCRSCSNMFGLTRDAVEPAKFPYGNCAEAESLSNLLEKEAEVKEQSQPTSDTWTPERIERAKGNVLNELRAVLRRVNFNEWDGQFYTPQNSTA